MQLESMPEKNHLDSNDLSFLIALNGYEEAMITELTTELKNWEYDSIEFHSLLKDFLLTNVIGVAKRSIDRIVDLTVNEAEKILSTVFTIEDHSFFLFLTEKGFERWETDDWGITTKRARYIMFRESQGSVRIQAGASKSIWSRITNYLRRTL